MPKRELVVLVQPPPPKVRVEVACDDLDECLSVASSEMRNPYNGPGTKITVRRGRKLLARWQVQERGARLMPLRPNGRPNDDMERLMHSARNAYVYEGMSRREVTKYLMSKHGASEEDAFLAAAAGKVLADAEERDYERNPRTVRIKAYRGQHGSNVSYLVAARSAKEAASLINAHLPRSKHLTPRWVTETTEAVVLAHPGVVFSQYGVAGKLERMDD